MMNAATRHRCLALIAAFWLAIGTGAAPGTASAQFITPDWSLDVAGQMSADPTLVEIEPLPSELDEHVYLLKKQVRLRGGLRLSALYGFNGAEGPLAIVGLDLIQGAPEDLYDLMVESFGEGREIKPLTLRGTKWSHEVAFTDTATGSWIIYDLKGDQCTLIYRPLSGAGGTN